MKHQKNPLKLEQRLAEVGGLYYIHILGFVKLNSEQCSCSSTRACKPVLETKKPLIKKCAENTVPSLPYPMSFKEKRENYISVV